MKLEEQRKLRSHRAKEAAKLRATGLKHAAIAERLGVARKYVTELLSDPDGSKARRRKQRPCIDCGQPTSPSGRPGSTGKCADCFGSGSMFGLPMHAYRRPERGDSCWRSDCDGPRECTQHVAQLERIRAELKAPEFVPRVFDHDHDDLALAA